MESRKDPLSRKLPNVDRLSSLPDPILCHILSFLPTKFSAATSILSRKWRSLWADVPIIDLDFQYNCTRNEEQPQISDIINRILFLGHKLKDLNTLRLKHHDFSGNDELTQHQLETWIAAVIARCKVQNIELHFNYCMKLPECLFTYRSLVDLRLRECAIRISLPASICFPCLEKLHLCSVIFHNDETFQQLISGCSHLEELMVINYDCSYIVCRRIYSPTLKWLTIDFRSDAQDHKVEIITPALQYLQVKDSKYRCISTQALSSLTEADITLKMYINDVVYSRSVLEFLDSMSNVKCLKLDINYDKFLQSELSISSQRFHNLTKLELGADWCFMLKFLEIADNLQLLIINWINEDLKCWVEPQQVFSCLQSHLRSVVINYFCCKEHEYTMVQYLLKNAKVLTSMKIKCQVWDEKKKDVALKRISLFEQGSDACKVDVY